VQWITGLWESSESLVENSRSFKPVPASFNLDIFSCLTALADNLTCSQAGKIGRLFNLLANKAIAAFGAAAVRGMRMKGDIRQDIHA
jgi:hypothetical protein